MNVSVEARRRRRGRYVRLRHTVLESSVGDYAAFGALRTSYRERSGMEEAIYIGADTLADCVWDTDCINTRAFSGSTAKTRIGKAWLWEVGTTMTIQRWGRQPLCDGGVRNRRSDGGDWN